MSNATANSAFNHLVLGKYTDGSLWAFDYVQGTMLTLPDSEVTPVSYMMRSVRSMFSLRSMALPSSNTYQSQEALIDAAGEYLPEDSDRILPGEVANDEPAGTSEQHDGQEVDGTPSHLNGETSEADGVTSEEISSGTFAEDGTSAIGDAMYAGESVGNGDMTVQGTQTGDGQMEASDATAQDTAASDESGEDSTDAVGESFASEEAARVAEVEYITIYDPVSKNYATYDAEELLNNNETLSLSTLETKLDQHGIDTESIYQLRGNVISQQEESGVHMVSIASCGAVLLVSGLLYLQYRSQKKRRT